MLVLRAKHPSQLPRRLQSVDQLLFQAGCIIGGGCLALLELRPFCPELVGNDVAELLQIGETFGQRRDSSALCGPVSDRHLSQALAKRRSKLAIGLYSDVHLRLGRVRNGVGTELHVGTRWTALALCLGEVPEAQQRPSRRITHFFMMMYLSALPRVCPSSRNSNDAAVSVEPGSCKAMLSTPAQFLSSSHLVASRS